MTTTPTDTQTTEERLAESEPCIYCLYYHCRFEGTPCEDCIEFNHFRHASKEHAEYERINGL